MLWRDAVSKVFQEEIKRQKVVVTKISDQVLGHPNALSKFFKGSRRELALDDIDSVASLLGLPLEEIIARARALRTQEEEAMNKVEYLLQEAKKVGLKDTLMETLKLIVDPALYDNLTEEAARLSGEETTEPAQQETGS